jgi:flagellar basal body-associated protein FliL
LIGPVLLGKELEMETITSTGTSHKQPGILYPLMLIAAIALIVFSIVGIATMMGWMPTALSGRDAPERATAVIPRPAGAYCADCGVIESIRANRLDTGVNGAVTYQIRVRMSDGATRTFNEAAQPALAIGQRVRVTERGIAAAG